MRKRTGTRYVPMTISVKPGMINEIEAELDTKESRSEWVCDAISKKLDGEGWNLVNDGNAINWFLAFRQAMDDHGVRIDMMFWEIIERNCREAVAIKASTDEH